MSLQWNANCASHVCIIILYISIRISALQRHTLHICKLEYIEGQYGTIVVNFVLLNHFIIELIEIIEITMSPNFFNMRNLYDQNRFSSTGFTEFTEEIKFACDKANLVIISNFKLFRYIS